MLRPVLVLLLATLLAVPAVAQSSGSIPDGTYSLEITFGGGVMDGALALASAADSLAVELHVGDHVSPVRVGERRGNRLVLVSTSPAVPIRYELTFQGDEISGTFTYNGETGSLIGHRRPGK